jgi:hypothetical protein
MAMSPLAAMLGGAFAPEEEPLAPEPLPGFNPMAPQMLGGPDLFAPDMPTAPDAESYDEPAPDVGSFLLPEPEAPDYSALLDPIRKEPGVKQRLMEAIIPLLAAGAIGKFGGGSQGAAGFLAGTLQGRAREEERELEQAKLDAARRERALTREATLANQRWERTQKQTAAVEGILKQAAEFDDPAAAQAWLQSIAPTYARLGIDTTKMGSTVLPGAQRKLREAAEKQYTTAIDVQKKLLPEGEKFNPEALHDRVSVTFRGKTMSLGELAQIAGMGGFDPATREATLKGAGNIENYVRDQFAAFEETTGRPPSRTERNQIVLQAQKDFAEAKVTPRQRALQDAQLQALQDRHNARTKGTGTSADWSTKYSPQQQVAAGRFASRYVAASKEFAKRSEAYDTIMSTVSRADKSPQAQIALVFAYMKMLDPGSVVRETEYATAQNAAGVPERVRNLWNKVKDGRFLSKEQIVGMAREGAGLYTTHRKAHDRIVGQFAQAAMRQNLDPRDILTDFNASNDPMRIPGVADTVPLEQDAEGNIAPVTPVTPTTTPGAARRPTATQTQAKPTKAPAAPKAGTPATVWVGMPVLIDGTWKKVTRVHANGEFDAN